MTGLCPPDIFGQALAALVPPGKATAGFREPDGDGRALLDAMASELARLQARICRLGEEMDPRTADELLADWERLLGLPDSCVGAVSGLDARRKAVHAKLTRLGGQSRAFFVALAAEHGFAITVEEFKLFRADESGADEPLYEDDWAHVWRSRADEETVFDFGADSEGAEDPLAWWGNAPLECLIAKAKPAHTHVLHAYGEPES